MKWVTSFKANIITTVFIILFILSSVQSLKILQIVPGFTNSHVLFNYRLSEALTNFGHKVVLWTQMEMNMVFVGDVKLPENVSEIRVPIHFKDKLKTEGLKVFQDMMFNKGSAYDLWWTGQEFKYMRIEACQQMLGIENDNLKLLNDERFDFAIAHFHDLCPVAMAEKIGIKKIIWITHGTSLYDYTALQMGLGLFPAFVPHPLSSCSDRMSFAKRVANVFWHLSAIDFVNLPQNLLAEENEMYAKEYSVPGGGDLWALSRAVNVLMINGERFLDFPRPLPTGIMFIGEVGSQRAGKKPSANSVIPIIPIKKNDSVSEIIESKQPRASNNECTHSSVAELPPTLAAIYSRAKQGASRGVVIFSLGTVSNTANMPTTMTETFVHSFGAITDIDFIWKTDVNVTSAAQYSNIHIFRWIPQKNLMKHKCTRLLIAHGGYNSFLEASQAGVPIVLMPLFADQFINAERARRFGIAEVLDKLNLNVPDVVNAIQRVLGDSNYLTKVRRLSAMLTAKPPIRAELRDGETQEETERHVNLKYGIKLVMSKRGQLFALKAAQRLNRWQLNSFDVLSITIAWSLIIILLIQSN